MDFKDFRFGNHTDIGKVRKQNEDYLGFFENSNGSFFVVCDGMGGHAGGAIASQTAVNAVRSFFHNQYYPNPQEALYQAIQYANQQIYQLAQMNVELRGMGTTIVLLMLREQKFYYAHVGDSRIYFFANHTLTRLTKDHSFVQALVEQGLITEAEAEQHPRRNELLRALGTSNFTDISVCEAPILPQYGDMFLLCSDGLNSLLVDEGIEQVLRQNLDIQHKAMQLVDIANQLGGFDNITVQLVEYTQKSSADFLVEDNQTFVKTNPNWETSPTKTNPDFSSNLSFTSQNKFSKQDETEDIEPIAQTYQTKRKRKKEIISVENGDGGDLQPFLLRGFLILFGLVIAYILYQNSFGKLQILGSTGDTKKDSLQAIQLENRFYEYFWNSSPELKKLKNTIDETAQTIREINDFRKRTKARLDSFFKGKEVRFIANSLNQESAKNLARRYRSRLDWILKANGVKSEEELKNLDSLVVPLEAPTQVEEEVNSKEEPEKKEK